MINKKIFLFILLLLPMTAKTETINETKSWHNDLTQSQKNDKMIDLATIFLPLITSISNIKNSDECCLHTLSEKQKTRLKKTLKTCLKLGKSVFEFEENQCDFLYMTIRNSNTSIANASIALKITQSTQDELFELLEKKYDKLSKLLTKDISDEEEKNKQIESLKQEHTRDKEKLSKILKNS